MAEPRIIVTRRIHADALHDLGRIGHVRVWEENRPIPPDVLMEWITDADACLSMLTDRIDRGVLDQGAHLKIVSNMAVGYDNFSVEDATRRGILMTNTPDVLTEATAELTWALLLGLLRNVGGARGDLLKGRWTTWSPDGFLGFDAFGKTLGIVGLGRIGQAVARRAPAFGMPVVALGSSAGAPRPGAIPRLSQSEFLTQADIVSLHVPLNDATRNLVNAEWLSHMKPGSFLINTARGPIVDETALLAALNQGHLAGAALDVFAEEPIPAGHPLASHPKVLATPHIGSATHETRRAMALRAAGNIRQALSGERPGDLINSDVWDPQHQ